MLLRLILKNIMRHKLRTFLTILGVAVAVMAFGLIRTVIFAWHYGVEMAEPDRLITRSNIGITFTLPLSYRDQIKKIDGVEEVTYANWFGGIYISAENFFPQYAVDEETYFDVYPEFLIESDHMTAFQNNLRAAIPGRKLADRFGWKIGDRIPLIGTIYHGDWDLEVVGIYTGKDASTDEGSLFMRWDYVDETLKKIWADRAGEIGWYGLKLSDPTKASEVSAAVDSRFKNSSDETLTETEKAFQMSFVQMSGAILFLLDIMSILIIGIILMVLVNTMAMTARERMSEYAFMKSMGFRSSHLLGMISGESLMIAFLGGLTGIALLVLIKNLVGASVALYFPVFEISPQTVVQVFVMALITGIIASVFPLQRAIRVPIVEGLRIVD